MLDHQKRKNPYSRIDDKKITSFFSQRETIPFSSHPVNLS